MCSLWTHRTCAKLKKSELIKLSYSSYYYSCPSCFNLFPYSKVGDDEFQYLNKNIDVNEDVFYIYNLYKDTHFNYKRHTKYNIGDWNNTVDPDIIFFNGIEFDCDYVADSQFKVQINDGLNFSFIHFNARSLKANIDNVKSYLRNLGKTFHIIAISESWFDEKIDEMNTN